MNTNKTELFGDDRTNAWKKKGLVPFLHTISKKEEYKSCINENRYCSADGKVYLFADARVYTLEVDADVITSPLEHLKSQFAFVVASLDIHDGFEIKTVYLCGDSEVEVLEMFFIRSNSLSYCNGHHVTFSGDESDTWREKFNKHFYEDKEGIGRYADMGGNMN